METEVKNKVKQKFKKIILVLDYVYTHLEFMNRRKRHLKENCSFR